VILAEQQTGPGSLDLVGTLAALEAENTPIDRSPGHKSRIVLAASFAHPDPTQPLRGMLELRDDDDLVADGFDPSRLSLQVEGGSLTQAPQRLGPGLYDFRVTAPAGSGGERLSLSLGFDGTVLARRQVPIGTDRWLAEGTPLPHGGCSFSAAPRTPRAWLAALAALCVLGRRRSARRLHRD
jgi:hypothetical protein